MENKEIAERLSEIAGLLEAQGANPFRVNAYRGAVTTVLALSDPVTDIVERRGLLGLTELPGIGEGIARAIYEYVATGRMSRLESLRGGGQDPVALFEKIPGIGATLAHRLVEALHLDSLEGLEAAIHNGRLNRIEGFSEKKIGMIQVWLAQMLGSRHARAPARSLVAEPGIELLLAIDRQYRNQAEAGDLPTITPKRFNPRGEAWLPIWHVTKNGWHFTALYSNTARAHQLKRSHDWVLIYFYDDQHHEGQHTVVTETRGPLIDKRVVRGREAECLDYYAASGFS